MRLDSATERNYYLKEASSQNWSSRLLERNINHLQKFLLELGKGFSFVAQQMRVSTETSHFYVDLTA